MVIMPPPMLSWWKVRMSQYPTIESCIGNTPLVRLQRLPGNTSNTILAKLEGNNPAGSVKDRPVASMIRHAQLRGDIEPGDTLIESAQAIPLSKPPVAIPVLRWQWSPLFWDIG